MTQKIKILSLLILFISTNSLAQNSTKDSLLKILPNTRKIERMNILNQLSKECMNSSVEEAIIYSSELLSLAEENNHLKYTDLACSILGEAYFYVDDIEKSIHFFEKFLETNVKQNDLDGIGTAYNNLGIVYRYIENYETSIHFYLESLVIKEQLKDSVGISTTLNNIGVMYFHMGDYTKALEYYQSSFALENALNNKAGIATSLLNIGEIYTLLNKYHDALSYFQRSIEISESIDDNYTIEVNYKCLYEMYKQKIDFQKALYYYEQYIDLKNQRLNQETKKEIAELEIQYETIKKVKEIELLSKQNEQGRITIIILFSAFIVFLLLLVLIYLQGRSKKKALQLLSFKNRMITEQSEILDKLNTTKDKFFSIISHDLKGTIGGFLTQTELLAEDFTNLSAEDTHDLIIKMNQSSEQLYALLENLLEWSRSQTGSIKINPEKINLNDLVKAIAPIYKIQCQEKDIHINFDIDNNINVHADLNMISNVFRNLIFNAIKFSYPKSAIEIRAVALENYAQIEVRDKGVGITEKDLKKLFKIDQSFSNPGTNRERGSGLGLILCKEFIEQNNGEIWVETFPKELDNPSSGGTSFKFTLKLA